MHLQAAARSQILQLLAEQLVAQWLAEQRQGEAADAQEPSTIPRTSVPAQTAAECTP